jgi:hypothetical protein
MQGLRLGGEAPYSVVLPAQPVPLKCCVPLELLRSAAAAGGAQVLTGDGEGVQ